jgi:hypothetical protein
MIHDIEQGDERDSEWEEDLIAAGLSTDESSSSDEDRVAAQIRRESTGQRKRRKVKEALFSSDLF